MQGSLDEITGQVQTTFAELTRYPLEVLELDADIEQDLGIDSVKLNEVLATLRERFGIVQRLEAGPSDPRTIRGLSALVSRALGATKASGGASLGEAPKAATSVSWAAALDLTELMRAVTHTFVQLTRYPEEVLEADADLEQDLGIDSVKLNEVLAALREQHGIGARLEVGTGEARTIRGISAVLARTLSTRASASRAPTAAAPQVATRARSLAPAARSTRAEAPPKMHDSGGISLLGEVFTTFAELTRYPIDVLEPDADLEQDLGIDSVKLNEVLAALRERFKLPVSLEVRTDRVRTIRAIAELISGHVEGAAQAPVARRADSVIPRALSSAAKSPVVARTQVTDSADTAHELRGKVVLVTGSGHGLGLTTARALAKRGARVVVNSFHSRGKGDEAVAAIRAAGGEAEHVWGSVAKPEHVERMFQEVEERMGGLDFFISNASNGHLGPAETIGPEHWEKAFRTNVMGFHMTAVAAARLMARRGGGAIVSMSCTGAARYLEHFACLGAVKSAVESLTRSLAIEFGSRGVRVNCVSAGPIEGALLQVYPDKERLLPYWESRTPTGRLCTEAEVADVVLFLLSRAARQINGTILTVDGGGSLRI